MSSKRRVKKQRKMLVMQIIKKIKKYQIPFDYKYGGGYFVFSFDGNGFNLHITFRELPMMKFGIWKVNSYGDKPNYYFAECFPYIDKFKPSCCEFGWDSLESMMEWVSRCIKEPKFYISELGGNNTVFLNSESTGPIVEPIIIKDSDQIIIVTNNSKATIQFRININR